MAYTLINHANPIILHNKPPRGPGELSHMCTINHSSRWRHTGQTPCPGLQTWPKHSLTTLTLSSCISNPSTHVDQVNLPSIHQPGKWQHTGHTPSQAVGLHPAHPSHFDMQAFTMCMRVVFQAYSPVQPDVWSCDGNSFSLWGFFRLGGLPALVSAY